MSYGDEWISEHQFEIDYPFGLPDPKDPKWTTGDLRTIRVSDMTDSHIRNCLKFVKGVSDEWEEIFKSELRKRGLTNEHII